MTSLLNKIFSFLKNLNHKNSFFDDLRNEKSTSLLFSAIEDYSENSEIRYVGGCIRKILNDEIIDDIDFAVNLRPNECIDALKKHNIKYYETGIEHGTITAIIGNNKYEITSLRKDVITDGRHAKVEFSDNWFEDASRRDFSINSIYADIDGNLYDPFNGKKDLELGKVEFIGDIEKRIKEDYLRILRYIRFFLNYSKQEHSNKVKKIIKQNISGISNISSERLLVELKKIILSKYFLKLFKDPFCEEIIRLIFPQFKNFEIFKKLNNFAKKNLKEVDYIFLICLMIVDDSDNVDYFLFKFNISNVEKKRILFLKKFYDQKSNKDFFSEKNLWKILYYNGKQSLSDLLHFEIFKTKKINKKLIKLMDFFEDKEVPIFPIKAKNLMEKYNISEGKLLGIKLKKIEEKWIDNNFEVSEKEVVQVLEN
ncbi:MAG TPA: CCA tRNA nucleotidyltransferase [Candidatus Pelagibacter bacterium]|jgi:poly(A) polymerase|nr:poly(A) polymerase [Pelagibacteraceae bacterium]HJN84054.1 CCA tRNA nucleotidyltransferase [Candidatus Pelagibacter bacterium]|tara:strand:- start:1808 stop:3082 length:1275 start_codon:yes stop_codon:yes gene_type:complete